MNNYNYTYYEQSLKERILDLEMRVSALKELLNVTIENLREIENRVERLVDNVAEE